MSNEQQFSDEYLNSFVDNELTIEEKSRVYITIHQDEALNRRVCELRKLHDVVQLAYKNLPPPPSVQPLPRKSMRLRHGVAASVVFTLGVLFSWFQLSASTNTLRHDIQNAAHNLVTRAVAFVSPSASLPTTVQDHRAYVVADANTQEMKVLFHLNSGTPEHIKEVLDEAENLLKLYAQQKQPARVEIITNGQGLDLLLADRSPFPARVSQMQKRYSNLTFAACQNTMEKYSELGFNTHLLPGTIVIESGVAQIIRLQQQGWVYIQV